MSTHDFEFRFQPSMVEELLHGNLDWQQWYAAMNQVLPLWNINTVPRVAGFIAQCGHESLQFKVLTENLNYSAQALNSIFPKYFKRAGRDANAYHRQPQKIANVIYANRMDNGNVESGDGWKFRGGGILQLTGRYNYSQFAKDTNITVEESIGYVRTKRGALASACWFWHKNNINKYCDKMDIRNMTKRINGGIIGLEDRKKHFLHALDVLGGDYEDPEIEYTQTVRLGSNGPLVKEVQDKLNIQPADGVFGPKTQRAVKAWQKAQGLKADGIVGPKTLAMLFKYGV